ncbi:MAG: hypothetical protein HFE47_04475 [Clostridia bacterium]|nr:hypothetical protein [Clostridia bacterium]
MKALRQKITIVAMVAVFAATGFVILQSGKTKSAQALSSDYEYGERPVIYYFSDSEPLYTEAVCENAPQYRLVIDKQEFLTPQKLAYMVYGGYFWDFESYMRNVVIIELKAMIPDPVLLENLFTCLHMQNCTVLFISPYVNRTEYMNLGADMRLACNADVYGNFIRNFVRAMNEPGKKNSVRANSVILLDGEMAGIDGYKNEYDLTELCANSPALRRLLLGMYYGYDSGRENVFETELYQELWQVYYEHNMAYHGDSLNYFEGDTNIADYVNFWNKVYADNMECYGNFWNVLHAYGEQELAACRSAFENYYDSLVCGLYKKNIHILAHTEENLFLDIPCLCTENEDIFTIQNIHSLEDIGAYVTDIKYVCGVGIWQLKKEFYDLLYDIQQTVNDMNADRVNGTYEETGTWLDSIIRFPIYIWEREPMEWDENGLEIINQDMLQEMYGEPDEIDYDEQELLEAFVDCLNEITAY